MITVAARIERLRVFARTNPEYAASAQLSVSEIEAILLMKRRHARRCEPLPTASPTFGEAVRWIADLGGYAGSGSGGPPGAVTIRRGLDFIAPIAWALKQLESEGKWR